MIKNNYKYYNKEKCIIILNHITNIKTYLTFCGDPLKQPPQKMGRQYFVTATYMG
jgi:hypothetical protein